MNYIRELLYRPRKTDRSNMARFFFADENLTQVAAELDSFDGRKDPERCACLVNRLRNCQDKLLNICNKMIEELEPGAIKRSREFRAKYPDDIMNDNLAGQLWFGAECLAAGSSIMNKESESESMRPLAKAVTKSLEKVRLLLREQCLSPQAEYTEGIRENLKIFDRLFADFEFNYVRCMVHVKSATEYELHQDLIVLFSETLMHALAEELIQQDAVDYCDPSLMFAIPRLAIVYGLLLSSSDGPLNVDRPSSEFPSLFLPFKNLLRKIRELLLTLEPSEVMVLEMLLCNLEEPAKISIKLKEVEHKLKEREKTKEGIKQADKLQAKLNGSDDTLDNLPTNDNLPEANQNDYRLFDPKKDYIVEKTSLSLNTKVRKRSKKRKHHSKNDGNEQSLVQQKIQEGASIKDNQEEEEITSTGGRPNKDIGNGSYSMLHSVDSIPCGCDESFVSTSGTDCDTKPFNNDELIDLVTPIVECLISTAVQSSFKAMNGTDAINECDISKLALEDKEDRQPSEGPRKEVENRKEGSRKEVEIDCTGPDIEVRISPQRRSQDVRQSSNNSSTPTFTTQRHRDAHFISNEIYSIRDYQEPEGSFSNGTYVPHVPPIASTDRGTGQTITNHATPSNYESSSSRRTTTLSSSLSGMGLPYQIPRPSMSQNVSPVPYSNSHVSPITHYYNDPYDVSGSTSHRVGLKRVHARRDKTRIPVRFQKDRRAKFKSTEDLLHRLYVCISGAADQLQSNYAGDFRSILRTVFLMNMTQDEEDTPQKEGNVEENEEEGSALSQNARQSSSGTEEDGPLEFDSANEAPNIVQPRNEETGAEESNNFHATDNSPRTDNVTHGVELNQEHQPSRTSPPSVLPSDTLQYDIGTDAIQHEGIVSMYAQHLGPDSESRGSMTASLVEGAPWEEVEGSSSIIERDSLGGAVYARNLDWAQQLREVHGHDIEQGTPLVGERANIRASSVEGSIGTFPHGTITNQAEFYQPEPALLDIARGAHTEDGENISSPTSPDIRDLKLDGPELTPVDGPPEISVPDAGFYEHGRTPPPWIPDEAVTACMGCRDSFTLLRRRHHCRNCGQVFCGRCSSQSTPLPQYRLDRPVRVCNRCFVIIGHQNTADLYGTSPRTPSDYNLSSSPTADISSPAGNDNIGTPELSARTPSNTLDPSVSNSRQNFYARNFGMVS